MTLWARPDRQGAKRGHLKMQVTTYCDENHDEECENTVIASSVYPDLIDAS